MHNNNNIVSEQQFNLYEQEENKNGINKENISTRIMAKKFQTVTVQQFGKSIILAIPSCLINFLDKFEQVIQSYNNKELKEQLLLYYKEYPIFKVIKIENLRFNEHELVDLYNYLKDNHYIEKENRKYKNIIILTAQLDNKSEVKLAIPLFQYNDYEIISSEIELNNIRNTLNNINFDKKMDKKSKNKALLSINRMYNKIINLEKHIFDNPEYLFSKSTKIYSDRKSISQIRENIEKKYIQYYFPQINYLNNMNKIIFNS